MPKFSYRLRDQHGGLKTGVLEALDHRLAREDLVAAGWKIETLAPADPATPAQPLPRPPTMVDFSEVFEKKPAPDPDARPRSARPQLDQALEEALKPTRPAPPSTSGPPSGTFSRPQPGGEGAGPPSGTYSRPQPGREGAGPPSGNFSRPQPGKEGA
ncbi:hypothetical protein DYH09_26660, partial [bacterium CPR1]|nr:hypothetical protein [bacterium CPR1]